MTRNLNQVLVDLSDHLHKLEHGLSQAGIDLGGLGLLHEVEDHVAQIAAGVGATQSGHEPVANDRGVSASPRNLYDLAKDATDDLATLIEESHSHGAHPDDLNALQVDLARLSEVEEALLNAPSVGGQAADEAAPTERLDLGPTEGTLPGERANELDHAVRGLVAETGPNRSAAHPVEAAMAALALDAAQQRAAHDQSLQALNARGAANAAKPVYRAGSKSISYEEHLARKSAENDKRLAKARASMAAQGRK